MKNLFNFISNIDNVSAVTMYFVGAAILFVLFAGATLEYCENLSDLFFAIGTIIFAAGVLFLAVSVIINIVNDFRK